MARFLRIAAVALVALVVLFITAVYAATQLIDPESFKPRIRALALEHGNLDLEMPGELAWTFWPSLGVRTGRVEARIHGEEDLFAALDKASLGVSVWPLVFRRVEMDEIHLEGMRLELLKDEAGGNWERLGPRETVAETEQAAGDPLAEQADEGDTALDIPVEIPQLRIRDSGFRYRNIAAGTEMEVDRFALTAHNLRTDQPFPVEAMLRYRDHDELVMNLSLETTLEPDPAAGRYSLAPAELNLQVDGMTPQPLHVRARQHLDLDLEQDSLRVHDLTLEAAGTRTSGELTLEGLGATPRFRGELHTEPFDLNEMLAGIGEPRIETADDAALNRIALETRLDGPPGSLMLNPLTLRLDDSTLAGRAGIEDLDTLAMMFDLDLDRIRVDDYLPPATETADDETTTDDKPPLSDEPLLTPEPLRELRLQGRLGIGELAMQQLRAGPMTFEVSARDGLFALERADGSAMDGTFSATGHLDVRDDTPELQLEAQTASVQIQPLVRMALEEDLFIGLMDLDTTLNARGNSERALTESAAGQLELTLSDGTVRGMNLHNVLTTGINDMLERYETLRSFMEGLDDGRRPRELREDTQVADLFARTRLEDRVVTVDELNADLERGARLHGDGWLNLRDDDFEFDLRMRAPGLSSNPRIAEREWPLRCAGNLAESPARWCRPRGEAFRNAGRELVERLVRQEVEERLGVDTDKAEEEVRERVREKRDEAEEKLRDRARDRLEGLFR